MLNDLADLRRGEVVVFFGALGCFFYGKKHVSSLLHGIATEFHRINRDRRLFVSCVGGEVEVPSLVSQVCFQF